MSTSLPIADFGLAELLAILQRAFEADGRIPLAEGSVETWSSLKRWRRQFFSAEHVDRATEARHVAAIGRSALNHLWTEASMRMGYYEGIELRALRDEVLQVIDNWASERAKSRGAVGPGDKDVAFVDGASQQPVAP